MAKSSHDPSTGEVHTPYINEKGQEVLSSKPMAPPVGYKKRDTMVERIRAMVRQELSQRAAAAGTETFAEADDFDTGEDLDPSSPYEEVFEPPVSGPDVPPGPPSPELTVDGGGAGEAGGAPKPPPAPPPAPSQG